MLIHHIQGISDDFSHNFLHQDSRTNDTPAVTQVHDIDVQIDILLLIFKI